MSEPDNIKPGTQFANRRELGASGIHRQIQAGIAWTNSEGAYSIVLSGGYEDDEDYGTVIVYTGEGGRDSDTGKQIADQALSGGNLALARSKLEGTPINVTRGYKHTSPYSPATGYQFAGKYVVTEYWPETGKSGYRIYRFRLEAVNTPQIVDQSKELPTVERRTYTSQRLVRDTKQALGIKELYDYHCQVCRIVIELPLGVKYAEGAHIRPLGRPHDGPDDISNLLCLCPNHHVMFDGYAFTINPESLQLEGALDGEIYLLPQHNLNRDNLRYHNLHFGLSRDK